MKELDLSYAVFKTIANGYVKIYWLLNTDGTYHVWAMTQDFFCQCRIIDSSEIADFEGIKVVAQSVTSKDDAYAKCWLDLGKTRKGVYGITGEPVVATTRPDGTRLTTITHDWCHKETWYKNAVYVEDEVATDSGDHTTYSLAHTFVIDAYHGLLVDEEYLVDADNRSYRVAVKVNDVLKAEQDPHYGEGGDFTVNYVAGTVTFLAPLQAEDVVKVTHHYATDSTYTLKPAANKIITISATELQISTDVSCTDTFRFQMFMAGNPVAPASVFKGARDVLSSSLRSYPSYPAFGGSGWRSMGETYLFDWDYTKVTHILGAYGLELRLWLEHHTPWTGTMATLTIYADIK
jgi:hypothetical protein